MARYRDVDGNVVEAVQLLGTTWDEMCEFAGVGKLADGKPEGCFIGHNGSGIVSNMGLAIPTDNVLMVAPEEDYVFRGESGTLFSLPPDMFEQRYKPVTA